MRGNLTKFWTFLRLRFLLEFGQIWTVNLDSKLVKYASIYSDTKFKKQSWKFIFENYQHIEDEILRKIKRRR